MCVGCRSSNGNTSREQGKAKQKADRQTEDVSAAQTGTSRSGSGVFWLVC
jgi:hypothetical protein